MGLFSRKSDSTPEAQELRAAKRELANDPVNTGKAGRSVDINSPAGRQNMRTQDRVRNAEAAVRKSRRG